VRKRQKQKQPQREFTVGERQKLETASAGIYCEKETKPEATSAGI
jgi:hypothetical protein